VVNLECTRRRRGETMHFLVFKSIQRFLSDVDGAVAVEYGIITVAMFLALVPGFYYVSSSTMQKFLDIGQYWFDI
jgi:Flp pilus assembly pilin Flp